MKSFRRLLRGLCWAGLLTILLTPHLCAQDSGVIEGFIRGPDAKPLPHVVVVLKNAGGVQVDRTLTNMEGHYLFFLVPPGQYVVSVEPKSPYVGDSRYVEIITGERDAHRRVDFQLDRLGSPQPTTPPEPVFVQRVPAEAEQAYELALELFKQGRVGQARAQLEHAIQLFPEYFLALNRLGLEALRAGEVAASEQWFSRALRANPNSASARFGMGWVHYQKGEWQAAAEQLRRSAELNPAVPETHWYLGLTALELALWKESEAAFRRFLALRPAEQHPIVYLYLASALDQQKRHSEAARALRTYLSLVPPEQRTEKLKQLLARMEAKGRP